MVVGLLGKGSIRTGGLSVSILAGGRSSRMGQNKALMRLPSNRPMVEEIAGRLSALTTDLFVVANDAAPYASTGLRIVPDRISGAGVLGGVYSSILAARNERCLVVACDMPFVSPRVAELLASEGDGCDVVICRLDNGEFEPMQAIYGKTCEAAIESSLGTGRRRVISFFDDVRVCPVGESIIREIDPDMRSFVNINTPEEFTKYTGRSVSAADGSQGRSR